MKLRDFDMFDDEDEMIFRPRKQVKVKKMKNRKPDGRKDRKKEDE